MTKTAKKTTIKILDAKFTFGREGTVRNASWKALSGQKGVKSLETYIANGGKRKYIKRWEKAGAIQVAA